MKKELTLEEETEVRRKPRLVIRKVIVGAYHANVIDDCTTTGCTDCGTMISSGCPGNGADYTISCSECGSGGTGC